MSLLSPKEVVAAVCDVIAQHNQVVTADGERRQVEGNKFTRWAAKTGAPSIGLNQYHWAPDGQSLLISFEQSPGWVLDSVRRKRKPTLLDAYWLARLRAFSHTDPQAVGIRVEIKLEQWVINKNSGKMGNRDKYELLVDEIWAAVSADSETRVRGEAEGPPVHEAQTSLDVG
jgi:hypothetical protein